MVVEAAKSFVERCSTPKEGEVRDEQTLGAAKPKLRNRFYFFS
jgi:hypothetical protein